MALPRPADKQRGVQMTGSLAALALAAVSFVGSHLGLSSLPVRTWLIGRLGEWGFRGVYSLVAMALVVWLVAAYNAAPVETVWAPPTAMRHLSLAIMPVACILLIGGVLGANPTAIGRDAGRIAAAGPRGIFKVTRHPVMWAFALWGISHLLANGDAADVILFGAITVLALCGAVHIDRRKRREIGATWSTYEAATSFVPFAACAAGRTRLSWADIGFTPLFLGAVLYAALLFAHPWAFGVDPLAVG
jgi:uncharacterized membrane protein